MQLGITKKMTVTRSQGGSRTNSSDHPAEILQDAIESASKAMDLLNSLHGRLLFGQRVEDKMDFYRRVRAFEIYLIRTALQLADGEKKRTAALLNLKRSTLYLKINSYGLEAIKRRKVK